jgi:uncharacterized protein YkwD
MGAAAGIAQAEWSEEDLVHSLLPHYLAQPEKCLRVHTALVQLVMLEKDRMLKQQQQEKQQEKQQQQQQQHQPSVADQQEKERERQLLAKKEQLEAEIAKKRKNSLKKQAEALAAADGGGGVRAFSMSIAQAINMVRTEPGSMIPYAQEHLNSFKDEYSFKDPLNRPNTTMCTKEGRSAVVECMQFLREAGCVPPLAPNRCLEESACEYAKMLTAGAALPAIGDHISRHGNWRGAIGQTVSYGNMDAMAIVLSLLIDDGSPDRGHRESIFDPKFLQLGAGLVKHDTNGYCCVIEYATTVLDWSSQQREDTIVSFSRSVKDPAHDEELFQKVLFSIPNDSIEPEVEDLLGQRGRPYVWRCICI